MWSIALLWLSLILHSEAAAFNATERDIFDLPFHRCTNVRQWLVPTVTAPGYIEVHEMQRFVDAGGNTVVHVQGYESTDSYTITLIQGYADVHAVAAVRESDHIFQIPNGIGAIKKKKAVKVQ